MSTALLQKLVEAQPEAEIRLTELARERANSIKQEFVGAGTIDEGRLTVLEPSATREKPYLPNSPWMLIVEMYQAWKTVFTSQDLTLSKKMTKVVAIFDRYRSECTLPAYLQ